MVPNTDVVALPSLASSVLVPWARPSLPPRRTANEVNDSLDSLGQLSVQTEDSLPPDPDDEVLHGYLDNVVINIAKRYSVLGCAVVSFPKGTCPRFVASAGCLSREQLELFSSSNSAGEGLFFRRIHRQAPTIVRDLLKENSVALDPFVLRPPGLRFYASVPIFDTSGELVGALSIYHDKPKPKFGVRSCGLLEKIASKISTALSTSRL